MGRKLELDVRAMSWGGEEVTTGDWVQRPGREGPRLSMVYTLGSPIWLQSFMGSLGLTGDIL